MSQKAAQEQNPDADVPERKIRPVLRFTIGMLALSGTLFGSAGRIDWAGGWVYLVGYPLSLAICYPLLRRQPGLIEERTRGWKKARPWDRVFLLLVGLGSPFATILVAGLDLRFGWSSLRGVAPLAAGSILLVAGIGLGAWAIASNPFFSSVIRIQTDRGHVVATGGPYASLRHPGYLGSILTAFGTPLILGSGWAFVPEAAAAAGIVARTALEDRILQQELPGYRDYAHRVRFRLVPGVW